MLQGNDRRCVAAQVKHHADDNHGGVLPAFVPRQSPYQLACPSHGFPMRLCSNSIASLCMLSRKSALALRKVIPPVGSVRRVMWSGQSVNHPPLRVDNESAAWTALLLSFPIDEKRNCRGYSQIIPLKTGFRARPKVDARPTATDGFTEHSAHHLFLLFLRSYHTVFLSATTPNLRVRGINSESWYTQMTF